MRSIDEQGYRFEEWLTPAQIAADVQQVAKQIHADYKEKEPLFVVVLNGAFVFAADLLRALNDLRCEVTFIRVSLSCRCSKWWTTAMSSSWRI